MAERFRNSQPAAITQCSQLDPAIWRRLPEEVLEVVFAQLPVEEIFRLSCLSKCWKRNVVQSSRFKELCAETSSRMFAFVCEDYYKRGLFWVKFYDTGTNKWHLNKLFTGSQKRRFRTLSAADGGLVCLLFPSKKTKKCRLHVRVCNPLTRRMKKFVLEGLSMPQVELLQIVTDQDTGHYKVIVVWRKQTPDHVQYVTDMLDSKTAKWIRLEDQSSARDSVWGIRYNWLPHELDCIGPCVWDSAAFQLNELDIPLPEDDVRAYALLKDRLFVLHMDDCAMPSTKRVKYYCISEYQGRTQRPNWVLLRTIGSMPFKLPRPPTYYRFKLHVCEGYFLVVANNEEWYSPTRNEIAWLYDLSTDEWRTLPRMPGLGVLVEQDIKHNPLCELRWDVDPDPKNVPGAGVGASSSL